MNGTGVGKISDTNCTEMCPENCVNIWHNYLPIAYKEYDNSTTISCGMAIKL